MHQQAVQSAWIQKTLDTHGRAGTKRIEGDQASAATHFVAAEAWQANELQVRAYLMNGPYPHPQANFTPGHTMTLALAKYLDNKAKEEQAEIDAWVDFGLEMLPIYGTFCAFNRGDVVGGSLSLLGDVALVATFGTSYFLSSSAKATTSGAARAAKSFAFWSGVTSDVAEAGRVLHQAGESVNRKDVGKASGYLAFGVLLLLGAGASAKKISQASKKALTETAEDASGRLFKGLAKTKKLVQTHRINVRRAAKRKAYYELTADIKANGMKEPIKYVEYECKNYVVDGHHRLRAALELGLEDVPVQQVELPFGGYRTPEDLLDFFNN